MRVLGAVLAGGLSSRFGSDKAIADFGGRTLANHAAAQIAPFVDAMTVIGPGGIADLPRGGLGPLGGVAAALDHAASHGFDCVLTIACDMPRLPAGLAEALLRRAPSYCVEAPVLGAWPAALGAQLLAHLQLADDRSVMRWVRNIGALPIAAGVEIENVNTREDLLAL